MEPGRLRFKTSSPLDTINVSCRHFADALQLAEDQRFAHEYGDAAVSDKRRASGQTTPEETPDAGRANAAESPGNAEACEVPSVIPRRDNAGFRRRTLEEESAEKHQDTSDTETLFCPSDTETDRTANKETELKNTEAVVIQQCWRKHRQKCANVSGPLTAEKRGRGGG
ncbi:hypothetical protein LDENG_00282450, partial [Lucifuga dentata]